MTMSDKITLAIRPSLAFPKRWSIDFWHNSRVEATYQAALFTYDSPDEAASEAANIQLGLEARGVEITRVKCDSNASRTIELPRENEEAIAKHLEAHVKRSFSFLKKFSLATLFDITSWAKGLKAVASRSPHVLSLIVLGTLFFRGPFERLLRSIVPKELELSPDVLLASAPLLLFVVTYFTYLKRVQMSNQLDRVRQWILQLVVLYGWDHVQVRTLVSKELAELEYASVMNIIDPASRQSPSSFSNLVQALGGKLDRKSGEGARDLVDVLLRDDFARKIQALAGMAAEPDYRPKQLGIIPLYFLLSISSVN
jgi:hypothetical protein